MFELLRYVPKNYLSYIVGQLVSIKLPSPLRGWVIRTFVRTFKIDLSEATKELSDYESIGALFIRDLKDGARPIGNGVVSPVDGKVREVALIEGDRLLQVKDKTYSFSKLVGSSDLAAEYNEGQSFNFYLSPPDYHHIHAPISGEIRYLSYIPGKLWPVNDWAFNNIDGLFAVNERVVIEILGEGQRALLVLVGATNVGKISLTFHNLVTNKWRSPWARRTPREFDVSFQIEKGERLGTFHMGSSVVLFLNGEALPPFESQPSRGVKFGEALFS